MIRACCPFFSRGQRQVNRSQAQVTEKKQRDELETVVVGAQPGVIPTAPPAVIPTAPPAVIPTAPPLDAVFVEGPNLSHITTQLQLQTDAVLRRNEELYAQQLFQQNQLSQIVETKHQGTMAQMRQMTQFAETDKQNRSTQGILDQARHAELEALQKRHQDALLSGVTQKKTPI